MKEVSVVITTRNRAKDLQHCLGSLAGQLLPPDEIVVIDNNSSDATAQVIKNFSRAVKFPVRHLLQTKVGYPHVYNRGLAEAKGKWVAFIDDDCIADPSWFKRIKFLTSHFPQVSVFLGSASEYYQKQTLSLTKSLIDEIGKIGGIIGRRVVDFEVLDSKNIIYNQEFLAQHKIKFDTSLLKFGQGASEDCDLGMQIMAAKGLAIYDDQIKVAHKDPGSLVGYYQKAKFTIFNHLIYEKKWSNFRADINTPRPLLKKINLFKDFTHRYQLGWWKSLLILVNLILTFVQIKLLRWVLVGQVKKMGIKIK